MTNNPMEKTTSKSQPTMIWASEEVMRELCKLAGVPFNPEDYEEVEPEDLP